MFRRTIAKELLVHSFRFLQKCGRVWITGTKNKIEVRFPKQNTQSKKSLTHRTESYGMHDYDVYTQCIELSTQSINKFNISPIRKPIKIKNRSLIKSTKKWRKKRRINQKAYINKFAFIFWQNYLMNWLKLKWEKKTIYVCTYIYIHTYIY